MNDLAGAQGAPGAPGAPAPRTLPLAPPSNLVGGEAIPIPGAALRSHNPARPDETVWSGAPDIAHVDRAVVAARLAFPAWSRLPRERRFEALRRFASIAKARESDLGDLICAETGKALWESAQEAALIAAKVDITLDEAAHSGLSRVTDFEFALSTTRRAACRFRPHGVMAVIGPFNFPAHLPNGHIVPALAAGNTVVFKPSDKAPAVGQALGEMLLEAGFPPGVVNVVQGGAPVAQRLVNHADIDGVLFTGSWPVGRAIMEANLDRPGRILALELGGNNAAVVMDDADLKQAAIEIVRCAFNTTGQRCTSTRRAIVHEAVAPAFLRAITAMAETLAVGDPRAAGVFMGPIIRREARDAVLAFQREAIAGGGGDGVGGVEVLLACRALDDPRGVAANDPRAGHYISPGVLRVRRFSLAESPAHDAGCDVEVFGPLLRISTCASLDDAIEQANATRYGLAASIFTRDRAAAERFLTECRAGCVNVNTGTAGASSKLPFGGLGLSGNHRPAGAFSLDYCAYPVAHMLEDGGSATLAPGMRFDEQWLR